MLARVRGRAHPARSQAFQRHGADFVVARSVPELVAGMNRLTPEPLLDAADLEREIVARDREVANPFTKDAQITAVRGARSYRGDRLIRTAAPHRLLDPAQGPAHRDPAARAHPQDPRRPADRPRLAGCCGRTARPLPGLYAAGEVAGFGGGGMHGYRSLEGTFLGGCLFSGRAAGRAAAADIA